MSSTLVEMLRRNSRASEIGVHRFLPTRQGDQYGTTRYATMLNDLRVPERHVVRISHNELRRPGKSLFRYFLGVKRSQVRILSARPEF
ncbi:MAG: hypothetical protein QOH27_4154 [Mycobacterium sp.]|jgi:hypothetical protein|nr:hypothetical protein [Mycobacterium sp.]